MTPVTQRHYQGSGSCPKPAPSYFECTRCHGVFYVTQMDGDVCQHCRRGLTAWQQVRKER